MSSLGGNTTVTEAASAASVDSEEAALLWLFPRRSAPVALRSYEGGVHLIAGGLGKRQDFSPLAPVVAERCRAVYLIGEASAELGEALASAEVPLLRVGALDAAVSAAAAAARPGDTVLL